MAQVVVDMGMSLDGYVAGSNAGPNNPLGDGGMRIHRWVFDVEGWRERQSLQGGQTNADDEVFKESTARVGAYVMGKRMFDEGEVGWPDPRPSAPPYSSSPAARGSPGSGKAGRPSTSSPRASRAPWSGRGRRRAGRTSGSRAGRTLSSSSWRRGWSTRSRSTSRPCCSATGCGCSSGSERAPSSWRSRG
jgi:hypothetical protein